MKQLKSERDFYRFDRLRDRVFKLIEKALKDSDGCCKSYEGAIDLTISYPNYFEDEEEPSVHIELHCYLLVSGRHITFGGETMAKALDRFEAWIKERERRVAAAK